MRILFISDNFPPEVNAPATRTYEHCRQWSLDGHSITVITCAPNFPQGRVYSGYKNRLFQREIIDGIDVIRVWSYIAPNEGFLRRIFDYASFSASAFLSGLFAQFDVIVATSPQFFTTLAGWGLSKIKRRPWVFELRDLWPESIIAVGAMRQSKMIQWLERLELFMYRQADMVVPVTPAFKKNLIRRGVDANKIAVVPNGANLELFSPRQKDQGLAEALGLTNRFVLMYLGTHGLAHGLDFVISAMAAVQDPEIVCVLVGDGANKSALLDTARDLGIRNVRFVDPIAKEDVSRYLSIADVALVSLRKSDTFRAVIPSKIFEAAAMGVPMLLGVDGLARNIVEEFGAGLYYEPENQNDFLAQLSRLRSDRDLYASLKQGGRKLAKSYDRSRLARDMAELFDRLVRSK